MYLTIRKIRKK